MKRLTLPVTMGVMLLLPLVVPAWGARQVPPNSYLRKPVSSVDELAACINKDPVVRNRFARHFGIPPGRLTAYLRENVVITRVTKSTPENIYIVTRDGRMTAQHKTLRQGTAVFALRDTGQPLLVLACGNPIIKKLPVREKVKSEAPQIYQLARPNETPLPPQAPVAALPPPSVTPLPPAPLVAPLAPVALPAVSVPAAVATHRSFPFPLLALLFGNNGGNEKPPVPPPPPPSPPPIPEPGGAAAVGATAIIPTAGWLIRRIASRRTTTKSE